MIERAVVDTTVSGSQVLGVEKPIFELLVCKLLASDGATLQLAAELVEVGFEKDLGSSRSLNCNNGWLRSVRRCLFDGSQRCPFGAGSGPATAAA